MYSQQIDRTNPGCLVLLLDQSGSMREPIANGGGISKADALARAVNDLLYELVLRCIKNPNEGPRHYYDVAVLGYGDDEARSALSGPLAAQDLVSIVDVANQPARVEEQSSDVADVGGDLSTISSKVRKPIWVDPVAAGRTPMGTGLNRAGEVVAPWVAAHPNSFPPIVLNVSDGAATDGDPRVWAERIRSLATSDGNVLFFNLNLSAIGGEVLYFPAHEDRLSNDYARVLFEMSSPLPPHMAQIAASQGLPIESGSRGYVFNADMSAVVRFLQIGTATAHAMA